MVGEAQKPETQVKIDTIGEALKEFVSYPKGQKKYREKSYQRGKKVIIGEIKDSRAVYKSILHVQGDGDFDDGGFYGFSEISSSMMRGPKCSQN